MIGCILPVTEREEGGLEQQAWEVVLVRFIIWADLTETLLLQRRGCWPMDWGPWLIGLQSPGEQGSRELERRAKVSWREEESWHTGPPSLHSVPWLQPFS